ncbi:SP family arabinose:H+ symporter-like MFS transporter [Pedobacter cryoconitis]|uniref:SP family arabinose:H+ symporter-like MFS transporter n=1 Tax=Pedobacter cryoconitis TaxID=188932 RepID=A0A7W8YU88_9SPHI|nr:sugar porter family MFS transporter [Pedobacter cryoconitis]MBB5621703.1 SP family arabinose:H+ symporter-like MFS transporter [Pedobacter cryoconitis]
MNLKNEPQVSYPKSTLFLIAITLVATLGGLLFGFDMAVISGVLPFVKQQFSLSPAAEGWFVSSALVGCIIGVAFAGELSDRFGRKKLLMLSALLFLCSAIGTAGSIDYTLLILARMMGGMGVGVASIVAPLYISEIAPAAIRGRLVTCYQLAITAGILVAYLTNAGLLSLSLTYQHQSLGELLNYIVIQEVWRSMLGLGVIPSLLFLIGLCFVPESPRWLIYQGREQEGINILTRISGSASAAADVFLLKKTPKQESGSYKELFAKEMRRPLLIGLLLPLFSQFSGINAIIYYGPRILNDAGVNITNALSGQIIFGLANFLFTLIAVWKVDQMGRRPLYIIGSVGATISLFFTGWCFYSGATNSIALVISIILFLACFAFSIGPLKFVIASEIFPTRIRGRAMGLSIMVMWIADTIVGQLTPLLLGSAGAAVTFWFFASCCLVSFIVVCKMVPETKGKSLEEVQDIFIH